MCNCTPAQQVHNKNAAYSANVTCTLQVHIMYYLLPESCRLGLHLLQDKLHGWVFDDLLHLRVMHSCLPPSLRVILSNTAL